MKHTELTAELIGILRESFNYEPKTGLLAWKKGKPIIGVRTRVPGTDVIVPTSRAIYAMRTGQDIPRKMIIRFRDSDNRNRKWDNLHVCGYEDIEHGTPVKKLLAPHYDLLHECFQYDPDTGGLSWKERPLSHFKSGAAHKAFNKRRAGTKAGTPQGKYKRMQVHMTSGAVEINAYVSTIVWVMMHREDPPRGFLIDFKDRNAQNCQIENLRLATRSQDIANNRAKPGKSGIRGVYATKNGTYQAQIRLSNPKRSISKVFDTIEEAAQYREMLEKQYFGEFAVPQEEKPRSTQF